MTGSLAPARALPDGGRPSPPEADPAPRARSGRRVVVLVGACALVAVASLPLPATLGYDPWAWLVWGREVGRLSLDTTGGPSWKPLPVLVTTITALAGALSPTLWLIVARTAGLLALAGAARVGARLAGPWAGALAAGLLVLTPDVEARYLRLVAEGHSAPITAALVLWAWERHLAGHHRTALVLATLLALDRPEAWPFLGLYLIWLWWRNPAARPFVAMAAVAVPVLWFGADWWGSGQPFHGAEVAQVDARDTDRLPTSLSRAWESVPVPVWVGASACVALALRARDRVVLVAAGAALGWLAVVVGMAVAFGYAAIGRFHLPGAAVLCVLAAVGVVRALRSVPAGRWRAAATVGVAVVAVATLTGRASGLTTLAAEVTARAEVEAELDRALAAAGGTEEVARGCGRVVIDDPAIPRVAVAWKLDLPLHEVGVRTPVTGPATAIVRTGGRVDRAYAADPELADPAARNAGWTVYLVGCPGGS